MQCVWRSGIITCVALVILVLAGGPVRSHDLNTSYTMAFVHPDSVTVTYSIEAADIAAGLGLDTEKREEVLESAPVVSEYVEKHMAVIVDGKQLEWTTGPSDTNLDKEGNIFLKMKFIALLDEAPAEVEMRVDFSDKFGPEHKNLAKIVVPDKFMKTAIFSSDNPSQLFILGKKPSVWEHIVDFTLLGVEHIFLGYDHIMFLLALIVVGGRLVNLIKIVSAFTVAHSITLILAALQVVELPGKLIEAGIALSIAYVALENFWLKRSDLRWVITFFFGLVHGFGFANVLRELGLPSKGLVASLLAFNVGVEIGQICIVAVLFPLIAGLSRVQFQRQVVWVVSAVILLFGLGWFVERVFELSYMPI